MNVGDEGRCYLEQCRAMAGHLATAHHIPTLVPLSSHRSNRGLPLPIQPRTTGKQSGCDGTPAATKATTRDATRHLGKWQRAKCGARGSLGRREKAGSSSEAGWAKSGIRESSETSRRQPTPGNLRSLAGGDRQLQSCQASSRMSSISLGNPVRGCGKFGKDTDFSLDTWGKGGHFRRRPGSSKEAGGGLRRIRRDAGLSGNARQRDAAGQRA